MQHSKTFSHLCSQNKTDRIEAVLLIDVPLQNPNPQLKANNKA